MMSSSYIEIEDVFLRTSDDCIAVYGSRWDYRGDSCCVSVRDSILWADVAHALNIGGHGDHHKGDLIQDIEFRNIDILEHHEPQPNYWGAMNINCGDKNTVRNVTYEDIRVEDFELGQLVDIRVLWNEKYNPVPEDFNTTLPFVRFQAGAGDYTLCYFDQRLKVTHAHMLAMGVIVYSPMQMMFWYDKPSDWKGEQEIRFWEKLPVVWDESIGISGEIGEYATIARRKESEWFIGCINNENARTVEIPLHFLDDVNKYDAQIYEDAPELDTRTKVEITSAEVTKETILKFNLESSGGVAIYLRLVP